MIKKRLAEIETRKQELIQELNGEVTEERLKEIEAEQKELEQEEKHLRTKLNVRNRLTEVKEDGEAVPNQIEERAREFLKKRATTISSGTIATPTSTQNEVNHTLESGNSILNMVLVEDCHGMGSELVPYEKPGLEADTSAEGSKHDSNFITDYAEIKPATVTVYTEVSREVSKLSPARYLETVQRAALGALRKKIGKMIVKSDKDESTVFFGINKAKACELTQEIEKIDENTLRNIILGYGGDEDVQGAAVLILTKEDLQAFGAVRGEKEKKAVYEIIPDEQNPNGGIIKDGGLSCRYSLNSALTALSKAGSGDDVMYYGKPKCYKVDIFSDYEITVSTEAALKDRMIAVLGEVMVGGNVTTYNGFTKIRKKSEAV